MKLSKEEDKGLFELSIAVAVKTKCFGIEPLVIQETKKDPPPLFFPLKMPPLSVFEKIIPAILHTPMITEIIIPKPTYMGIPLQQVLVQRYAVQLDSLIFPHEPSLVPERSLLISEDIVSHAELLNDASHFDPRTNE